MSAANSSAVKPRRPNGHADAIGECTCPACGQPLSAAKYSEILHRLSAHDEQIAKAVETRMKGELSRAVREATRTLREGQEATIAARVAAEREKAGKATSEAVAALRLEHAAEKVRLESALADVQRKLAAKTAFHIGEKPEADLAQTMAELCAGDRVTRTARGVRGGDVLIEVLHGDNQVVAGKILLDSKAVAKWQSSLSRKLAIDKSAIEADFGLLVTTTLPTGEQQTGICIRDGIICCTPDRAPVLVTLLRRVILDNYVLKLSVQQRDTKADRLFSFIVSGVGNDLFDRLIRVTRDLEALGVAEERSHKLTWSKRTELVRGLAEVHATFTETIAEVVGGSR